jgi:hypothetical protein
MLSLLPYTYRASDAARDFGLVVQNVAVRPFVPQLVGSDQSGSCAQSPTVGADEAPAVTPGADVELAMTLQASTELGSLLSDFVGGRIATAEAVRLDQTSMGGLSTSGFSR